MTELKDDLAALRIERQPESRVSFAWVKWVVLLVLIGGASAAAYGYFTRERPIEVEVASVTERAAGAQAAVLNASGYVTARRRATVSSKVTGKIVEVNVEEGMAVKEGQVLARLDDAMYRAALALAEAQAEASRRGIKENEVRLEEAKLNYNRFSALLKEGIVTQADVDTAKAGVDSIAARIGALNQQTKVAERQIDLAQTDLDNTIIRAPFSGMAISKDAQPGEMVSPVSAGGGFTRTGICTMVDMRSLEIEVDVNESYINRVRPGQDVTAMLDAYPDWQIPAEVITAVPDGRPPEGDGAGACALQATRPAHSAGHGHQGHVPRRSRHRRPSRRCARQRSCRRPRSSQTQARPMYSLSPGRQSNAAPSRPVARTATSSRSWPDSPRGTVSSYRRRPRWPQGKKDLSSSQELSMSLVKIRDVHKHFTRGNERIDVLQGVSLEVRQGEFLALMGPSGSGKTTLLNLMGGLDSPTGGSIEIAGSEVNKLGGGALARWRARHIGFVFQLYNLLPVLTAERNVELPLLLTSLGKSDRRKRAAIALKVVGLGDRLKHYPRQLSGGQEQRVGIARAIVNDPTLLLCDEPTGDLDRKAGDEILDILQALNKEHNKTIVMVTHDPHAAERATRTVHLEKGTLVEAAS